MASYFEDNEDLRFYFDEGVDWAALAEVSEATRTGASYPGSGRRVGPARRRLLARLPFGKHGPTAWSRRE